MNPTIQKIRKSLKENIDNKTQKNFHRFFKEEVKCYGVKTAIVRKIADEFEPNDWIVFKNWVEKYVNNWAKCDGFCNHTMGSFLVKYPAFIEELKEWTQSKNRWLRRAAAVSLCRN